MLSMLKQFFAKSEPENLDELLEAGAVVVDVRNPSEYAAGHFPHSINVPLQQLQKGGLKISKRKAIITCCASGVRSAAAKKWLESNGYQKVVNGGSWQNLIQNKR